jgi:hypothetical protein
MKSGVLASLLALTLLSGCAHPILIGPDNTKLPTTSSSLSPKTLSVGYFISDADRARRVITPGGGGDKVEYAPYKDLEPGLFRVLGNVFTDVHVLKSPDDKAYIVAKGIKLILRPTINTNSSSPSPFTWPPTNFEVLIDVQAVDAAGTTVWKTTVSGKGQAEFSEFKSDFGLAAKRASEAALTNLQAALVASPMVR